jgi:hypothetical protein
LKIKLKGLHVDTIEVTETELEAVLNTRAAPDLPAACTTGGRAGTGAGTRPGGGLLRVWW